MSFPCREFGGGGFFRSDAERLRLGMLFRSSSEASCDVRGDSEWLSCTLSKIECRETDEASVLLPSVNPAGDDSAGIVEVVAEAAGPLLPVMRRR